LRFKNAGTRMITAAIFVSLLFVYALLSKQAAQTPITAPILFTAAGMVMSPAWCMSRRGWRDPQCLPPPCRIRFGAAAV
jgi:hypothetical protein